MAKFLIVAVILIVGIIIVGFLAMFFLFAAVDSVKRPRD